MSKTTFVVFAFAVCLTTATALAQATGEIFPIKTPPLSEGQVYTLPITRHFDPMDPARPEPPAELPGSGWAGARVKIHVLDPTEVDIASLVPAPGYLLRYPGLPGSPVPPGTPPGLYTGPVPDPFGPRSHNVNSVPVVVTLIHPLAQQSGINPPASHLERLLDVVVHAKNTNMGGNSDIDVTLMFEDIWHTRDRTVPGSTVVHFPNSVRFWSHSNLTDDPASWEQLHNNVPGLPGYSQYRIPEGPPLEGPEGHWVHIPASLPFHNPPGVIPGSNFFAYMATTVLGLGIEHVPEPVSIALFGSGLACAAVGLFSRRRRRLSLEG
jgi:hypothetical protein